MFVWSKLTAEKWVDAWEERFSGGQQGTLVVTVVAGRKTVRLELYCPSEKIAKMVQKEFGGSVREVKSRNWAALQPTPLPVKVRDALVICAARSKTELAAAYRDHPGREVIAVPADMAFGTGHHATTATVLRCLVDEARRLNAAGISWKMADLGCGSGILAIAAQKLGAVSAWGCDFDPKAVKVARENALRNGTPEVTFEELDVVKWKPRRQQRWQVVAANLFSDVLEAAAENIVKVTEPGGLVLLSGILNTHAEGCLAACQSAGLQIEKVIPVGKWVTAMARRL